MTNVPPVQLSILFRIDEVTSNECKKHTEQHLLNANKEEIGE